MARGATLLRCPCGATLSERYNGRDPAGAGLPASPRQLHAEFGPHSPPVFHRHRLAQAVAEPTTALQRLYGGEYTEGEWGCQTWRTASEEGAPRALSAVSLPGERDLELWGCHEVDTKDLPEPASERITERIKELGDWRGERLAAGPGADSRRGPGQSSRSGSGGGRRSGRTTASCARGRRTSRW
jgi:hypothetical protein